jgi:exonuclease III
VAGRRAVPAGGAAGVRAAAGPGLDRRAPGLSPRGSIYTFWDYLRYAWRRDAGLRLDHLLLSPNVADRLVDAGVDREVRGLDRASDHAPAWIEIAD